jgi:lipopolysaccharide export system protein LptA
MKIVKLIFLCCVVVSSQAFSTLAYSKTGDNQQPMQVEADRLEVRDNDNISIYSGNVKLTQGSLEIHANLLTLYFDDNKILTLMKMSGSLATFRQLNDSNLEITGQAREMEYQESKSTLLLLDNAKLTQGADIIESNKIILDTNTNSVEAGSVEPDNRVRMVIQPKQPAQ